jgi:hypothetical protein
MKGSLNTSPASRRVYFLVICLVPNEEVTIVFLEPHARGEDGLSHLFR